MAITYSPPGSSRSARGRPRPPEVRERRQDREAEHGQRDDGADRRAEAERRGLEESRARVGRERLRRAAPVPAATVGSSATARVSGSMAGTSSRTSRVTSRAQRIPNTTAMTAPMAATIQLMTSPTRRHATPIAKAIGQRLGPGTCGVSWLVSLNSRPARGFNRPAVPRVNDVPSVATRGFCTLRRTGVRTTRRSRTRPSAGSRARGSRRLMTISSGQGRASSSGSLCVASMPSLPP